MDFEFYKDLAERLMKGEQLTLASSLDADTLGKEWIEPVNVRPGIYGHTFHQRLHAPTELVICGGGHVSRALAPIAKSIGFKVTVLENRPEVLNPRYFPVGTDLRCGNYETLLHTGRFSPLAFYVVVTNGHSHDSICTSVILNMPYAYLGMIGSRAKVAYTHRELISKGFTEEQWATVHSPIGLEIGSDTPAEIAISIAAELIKCRSEQGLSAPIDSSVLRSLTSPPYAKVTLTDTSGSTPRAPGAWMLVFPDGTICGTIGGGGGEAQAIKEALISLCTGRPIYGSYGMNNSADICGGSIKYLIIPVKGANDNA